MNVKDFNTCVDNYSDGVYRFILKSVKDEDLAKDIVQDAFEKLWLNVEKIEAEKSKAYLFTTAYHRMIDILRRNKFKGDMDQVSINKHSHSDQYSGLSEVLENALNRLPENQRSLILLRDYEGYSYKEIGEIMSLSEAQVKVYIFRARMFLKELIGSIESVL